jgi:hypothetical protein
MTDEFDLIVAVVKQPTEVQLVSFHWLILQSVCLFSPLLLEYDFLFLRLVTDQNGVIRVITECIHHVVL